MEVKDLALAFNNCGPTWQEMIVSPRLIHHLLLDIVLQVGDGHDIVIYLFMLTGDHEHGDLVQDHSARRHQFQLEHSCGHSLTGLEIKLVDHFDGHMDSFARLSKLDAHFVDSIDDSLSALNRTTNRTDNKYEYETYEQIEHACGSIKLTICVKLSLITSKIRLTLR